MPDTAAPAPVSAPAAPAPAAPAAPAPAAAAPAPATPSPTVETATNIADAWKAAVESVPTEEPAAEPVAEPAAEPGTETTEADPAAAAAEPGTETTEADPAAAAEPVVDDLTLQIALEEGDFGPKELGDFLKKDAAVEKFFNDNPDVKNRVFAMARRDSETRSIREIVPTLALAQEMQRGHQLFSDIDGRFLNATTPEGYKAFMDMWVEQAIMTDDAGKPIIENGKYKVHPALTSVIENIHSNRNKFLADEMATSGKIPPALADSTLKVIDFLSKSADEGMQEAARLIKEAITPSSSAEGELPDELKPHSDRLKAREKALDDRDAEAARTRQESEQAARTQALERADMKAAKVCVDQVTPLLKSAGLTPYEVKNALAEVGNRLDIKLKAATGYQTARNRLEDGTLTPAREKEISKLALTYSQELLGPIVRDVIREATQGKLDRQTTTAATVDAQRHASRTDARGTSVSTSPGAPLTSAQIEDAIVTDYKAKHNGDTPDRRYITDEMWKRMNAAPARR